MIPAFIGEGIPLVAPRHRLVPLELRSVRRFSDGVVRLHYDVTRQAAASGTAKKRAARPGIRDAEKIHRERREEREGN